MVDRRYVLQGGHIGNRYSYSLMVLARKVRICKVTHKGPERTKDLIYLLRVIRSMKETPSYLSDVPNEEPRFDIDQRSVRNFDCKYDRSEHANMEPAYLVEICKLMDLPTIQISIQYASKIRRMQLATKIS